MAQATIVARSLRTSVELSGAGLHSGQTVTLKLHPAAAGEGISFVRTDLASRPLIKVTDVVNDAAPFRTVIRNGGAEVHTIEHLMSALSGLGVTDARIEISGVEVPGMDGSALNFVEAIQKAGVQEVGTSAKALVLEDPVTIEDGMARMNALPNPGGLKISYTLNYPGQPIAQGFFEIDVTAETFVRDIAPARTFAIKKDAEAMRAAGLGKGATLQNTVVIDGDKVLETKLRFSNEPVRHKILDLIGDLFVLGCPLHAHIVARCSGHKQNRELALKIREAANK
ncbi:MAG TPA: UDP-3-O-acyl-N-acetylglucosamine deacetylase [Planctomycetota bacterium]|nr:UDP-3-O-acyl-N-acetylglucosamine deacetylase [Planctomycetota bacterium]